MSFSCSLSSIFAKIGSQDGAARSPAKPKPKSPPADVFSFSVCHLRRITARCSVHWQVHPVFWKAW